ncbi:MAG: hypothetical protein ACK45H_10500 [Bacteroidota bacterium]|jgi:hypothetical protein
MNLFGQNNHPESLKDQIIRILNEEKMRYSIHTENNDEVVINLGMALSEGNVDTFILAQTACHLIEIVTFAPLNIPENKRSEAARYCATISTHLSFGAFEMNHTTGQLRTKTYLLLPESLTMSDVVFKRCFLGNLDIMDRYFSGMMQIVYGNISAQSAIEKIHNRTDPQLN